MAIDLGTLYTTIEAQTKGYAEANKETEKLARSMLRQADAIKKAELEVEKLNSVLKGSAGSAKHLSQASEALSTFKKRAESAGSSSVLLSAAQKDFKNTITQTKIGLNGAGVATSGWQQRMQELTKSVQLALGPLSGVAARITALTALFNRSTLIWAGLFASITAITISMYKAVAAGSLYENSMAKITHQLEMTGHASGQTTEDIDKMTKALAINTLASVQGARDAATAILTFTSITGDNVERTLNLAQDLTDSLGGDLLANAKKLGKMFEDPSKAFEALNEMGARLSDTEKERLKIMAATGDHLGAQEALFAKIESRVKGISKAGATDTLSGAYDTLGESLTLLYEAISKDSGMLKTFKDAINSISESIQSWTKTIEAGSAPLEMLGSIVGGVVNGLAFLVKHINAVIAAFGAMLVVKLINAALVRYAAITATAATITAVQTVAVEANGVATVATTKAINLATLATKLFNTAMASTPWGLVMVALAGAAAAWLAYGNSAEEASDKQSKATKQLTAEEQRIKGLKSELEALNTQMKRGSAEADQMAKALSMGGLDAPTSNALKAALKEWAEAYPKLQQEIAATEKALSMATNGTDKNTKATLGQVDALKALVERYNPASNAVNNFVQDQKILAAGLQGIGGELLTVERYLAAYANGVELTTEQEKELRVEHARLMANLTDAKSMAALSSPFQKAKEEIHSLIKAQRSAAQSAGLGVGMALTFTLDQDEIQKKINAIRAGIISDPSQAVKLGLDLDGKSEEEVRAAIAAFVTKTMKDTQSLVKISPFTSMLKEIETKIKDIQSATATDPINALFSNEAYQKALAFDQVVTKIKDSLASQDIQAGSEEFNRIVESMKKMAESRGLEGVFSSEDLTTLDGLAKAFAKLQAKTKEFEEGLGSVSEAQRNVFRDIEAATKSWSASATSAVSDFVKTGKADFSDFAKSVIDDMIRITLQRGIMDQMFSTSGTNKGIFSAIGSFLSPNAKGNAFNNGSVTAFAKGGAFTNSIVSSPTTFPMAKGAGLMGEAGPEAIMPLTRTSGGDLGVKMVGGGSGGDNIVVNVQVDASGTSSEGDNNSSKQLGAMIGNAVKGILIQEKRPGGILA